MKADKPLRGCLRASRQHPALQSYAAADAMAKGENFGIGGWLITSSQCAWFSEQYGVSEAHALRPQLQDSAQRYIACFDTLAQLALAMMAHRACPQSSGRLRCRQRQATLRLKQVSTNSGVWSTAEPLGSSLSWQKLGQHGAAYSSWLLRVTHIAGEKNTWADALSRNRLQAFQNRMHERHRFALSTFKEALGCIALRPQGAAWPDELAQAQRPTS